MEEKDEEWVDGNETKSGGGGSGVIMMARQQEKEDDCYEILFLSEIVVSAAQNIYPGKKVRTIGYLEIESLLWGKVFYKESILRINIEFIQLERIIDSTFYHVLGELYENSEGLFLKAKLIISAANIDLFLYETVVLKRRNYLSR